MSGRRRAFTLLELLVVLFIMVISGSLVIGALTKLPVFAIMSESSGRVESLYNLARELAVTYNRTFVINYYPEENSLAIDTIPELDEPDYGALPVSVIDSILTPPNFLLMPCRRRSGRGSLSSPRE